MLYNLEPNDTIVMCNDSVVMKLTNVATNSLTNPNYNATNWADIEIAKWVSITIISIAFICFLGLISYRLFVKDTNIRQEKITSEEKKTEKELKIKAELLERKLSFYEQLCYEKTSSGEKDGTKTKIELKSLDSQEVKTYIAALDEEIKNLHNNLK